MRPVHGIPRRQVLFLTVYVFVGAAMLWPIYTLVTYAEPLIFGLPPSLAWLAACIAILFAALVVLYRADCRAAR